MCLITVVSRTMGASREGISSSTIATNNSLGISSSRKVLDYRLVAQNLVIQSNKVLDTNKHSSSNLESEWRIIVDQLRELAICQLRIHPTTTLKVAMPIKVVSLILVQQQDLRTTTHYHQP